jgi:hypothetical protein
MVKQLERDLPELLSFFSFPKHLWRQLRTTNVIERVFVEVRRRTRPMVCVSSMWPVSTGSSTRSFTGLIWNGATAPSSSLHKLLDITLAGSYPKERPCRLGGFRDLIISSVAHLPSLQRMGIEIRRTVNVGGFTAGQRTYLDFHRNAVLLRAVR